MKHEVGRRREAFCVAFSWSQPLSYVRGTRGGNLCCARVFTCKYSVPCLKKKSRDSLHARSHAYPILGQFSRVALIVLEENPFLSSCLEFSSARNDLSKVRERKSKSLKGLAQTLHLCGGHSEVKRIRLPQ